MIIPSMSEEQILENLISDYNEIRKLLKNEAQRRIRKEGIGHLEGTHVSFTIPLESRNSWFCDIYFRRSGTALWYANECCIVESDYGTKDYYFLRNRNMDPYFIKITSHAVKRIRERSIIDPTMNQPEKIVMSMFVKPEIGVATRYFSVNDLMKLYQFDDVDSLDNDGFFVMFFHGLFLANRTKFKNWIFQTHVSFQMVASRTIKNQGLSMDDKQGSLFYVINHIHRFFNKKLWEEEAKLAGETVEDSQEFANWEWPRESDKYFLLDP